MNTTRNTLMPYTQKQEKLFRAVAHGWKPDDESIKLSAKKAKGLLADGDTERGQKRAFRRMKKEGG